jgi:ubiquinone/menaquinone biosynthesis C-methylase UbiE
LAHLPFDAASFDFVTANMVVEHLEDPSAALREVHRTLKPKGKFLFHTPNVRNWVIRLASLTPDGIKRKAAVFLHGRKETDIFPTHYRMNTPEAVRELAERNGFRVVELATVNSSATFIMLGPVVLLELLATRLLESKRGERYRTIIIAKLEKI